EAIATVLALRDGFCPPTIHLDHPDPACDLDYVPNVGVAAALRAALSISLGFGGHNSVLMFRRFEG
ncbi:MAG: beta-ketoacyl-[acyl-carrier-protein] synthase II, partial [Thermoguttaceae bacterium]|nr:beta-ketoacyl-[acyl-carrier-protein] synthase II [Thermoguttaceae bacterium]